MKKKHGALIGFVVLLIAAMFTITGCDTGLGGNTGDPQTVTYSGMANNETYTLKITKQTSRAAYTPQSKDSYELTITPGNKKSSGTITVSGSTFTLTPTGKTAFTVTISGTGITAITGTITFTDNTTKAGPGTLIPGGGGGGGDVGTLTFTDNLPSNEDFSIFITTAAVTNYRTAINAAENRDNKTAAIGSYLSTSNRVVALSGGGKFNPNGIYTVIYWKEYRHQEIKYQTGVKFSGGNASISFNGMTTLEYQPGSPATLTFTGTPPKGIFNIFVSSAVVTDYLTAMVAVSSINNDIYAGADESNLKGSTLTLDTIDDFNPNGTYTVIYGNDNTPLELKFKTGVKFSSGAASIALSSMTTVGGSENALVITGFSNKDDCAVFVTTGNPATLVQAGLAMQGAPGVGSIAPGENFVRWTTLPGNGTYTVILIIGETYKKATRVTITNGVGSVNYTSFVDIPLM
jgi:hypothetical protein